MRLVCRRGIEPGKLADNPEIAVVGMGHDHAAGADGNDGERPRRIGSKPEVCEYRIHERRCGDKSDCR